MTPMQLYLILRLDTIHDVLSAIVWVSTFVIIISSIIFTVGWFNDEISESITKKIIKGYVVIITLYTINLLLYMAVPTTKQAIIMYSVPAVMETTAFNEAAKTPEKVMELLNLKLDEKLNELKKGEKE